MYIIGDEYHSATLLRTTRRLSYVGALTEGSKAPDALPAPFGSSVPPTWLRSCDQTSQTATPIGDSTSTASAR